MKEIKSMEEVSIKPEIEPDIEYTKEEKKIELNRENPSKSRGFAAVLQNRSFLILWIGQVFSQLADKIYLVLTIGIIASRFENANEAISGWVSGIMIAFTIPAILFGSLAGVYVDRWSKKEVLVISNLVRGILILALPLLLWLSENKTIILGLPVGFWTLLGVTFIVSTLTQFFAPAEQATIPLIVKRRNLLSANSLYTTTMMAATIIGFAIGEPLFELADELIAKFGLPFGNEVIVGGGYAIAGLLLLLLKTEEKLKARKGKTPHVLEDIKEGILHLGENHQVRNALIQLIILFCVFAALAVLTVRLAEVMPLLEADQFGFFLAAAGVGMGISAAILGHWGNEFPYSKLSLVGSIGVTGSLLGLASFTHNLPMALTMTFCLGLFAALIAIPMQTIIQAETPEEMRGKVFGLQNNAVNIALSLPLALAGLAEGIFGLKPVLIGLAVFAIIGGVIALSFAPSETEKSPKVDY